MTLNDLKTLNGHFTLNIHYYEQPPFYIFTVQSVKLFTHVTSRDVQCTFVSAKMSNVRALLNDCGLKCHSQHHDIVNTTYISVGAQSTLGARHFCPKYMHEKLTKCLNFTWYLPRKINKVPEFYMIFARKIFLPEFGGGNCSSLPPVSYAYESHMSFKWSRNP